MDVKNDEIHKQVQIETDCLPLADEYIRTRDRMAKAAFWQGLGIESVDRVVSRGRLRWYGHVERKAADDWVSKCRNLEVERNIRKGRSKKAWMECVATDMKGFGLKKEDAQDRSLWSSKI